MEATTSTGVRGTALSGGPPTKATGDGSLPLTGKAPAEAPSVSGEKPSAGDRPPRAAAAGAAVALLRSGEDGSISQEDAESLFKYLVDNKLAEKAEAFYGNYFVTPVLLHLAELIKEHGAVDNSIYKKVEEGVKNCFDSMLKATKAEPVVKMVMRTHADFEKQLVAAEAASKLTLRAARPFALVLLAVVFALAHPARSAARYRCRPTHACGQSAARCCTFENRRGHAYERPLRVQERHRRRCG